MPLKYEILFHMASGSKGWFIADGEDHGMVDHGYHWQSHTVSRCNPFHATTF